MRGRTIHFSPALAQGARRCARGLTRTQRLQAAWAARRTKTTAASAIQEKSAGPRLVPGPAPTREALFGFVLGDVLKQKPRPLCASQEKCYNLICPKMLLFAGNFDPALRLRTVAPTVARSLLPDPRAGRSLARGGLCRAARICPLRQPLSAASWLSFSDLGTHPGCLARWPDPPGPSRGVTGSCPCEP